jgi:endonuclease/exonuclease/phosphatase family metal-dependent hydrolase
LLSMVCRSRPEVRVLTLNLWNVFGPWELRCAEIVHWLCQLTPDVICLQEVVGGSRRQLDELIAPLAASGLRYHATYRGTSFDGGRLGNAILTRRPHLSHEPLALPPGERNEPARTLLGVDLGSSHVLCTHLSAHRGSERFRARQLEAVSAQIASLLREDPRRPVVFAGDLNCHPDAPELQTLLDQDADPKIVDAWRQAGSGRGHTWDHSNPFTEELGLPLPPGRLDYVLIAPGVAEVAVRQARVVCDRPLTGVYASDHFGVLVDLEVADAR